MPGNEICRFCDKVVDTASNCTIPCLFFTSVSVAVLSNCLFNVSDDNMVSKVFHQALCNIAGVSLSICCQVSTIKLDK